MPDKNPKRDEAPDQRIHVHGGEPNIFNKVRDVYLGTGSAPKDFKSIVEAAQPYLTLLATECGRLPLRGLDPKASDPLARGKLGLDAVYVGLDTTSDVEADDERGREGKSKSRTGGPTEERKPLSALRAVAEHRHVVLLGNPGSGKTTFLNHVALCFARQQTDPGTPWLDRLADWPKADRQWVPVVFTLRRFVAFVLPKWVDGSAPPQAGPEILWEYLESALHKDACKGCVPALRAAADLGMALVILDGLDEVASDELRVFVRDCAQGFAVRYPKARLVLTCRTIPYENPKWQLAGIPSFRLKPFDDAKIEAFVHAWFGAHRDNCGMPAEQASAKDAKLLGALRDHRRREMHALAGNPMLLTVMALLQSDHRELPENRAELYEEVIKLLLQRWDDTHGDDGAPVAGVPQLLREANADTNDLQRVLWSLAYRAQASCRGKDSDALADIPRSVLHKALVRLHPKGDFGWANRVVETIKERSGLLLPESEDVFRFPHRSFQEYLSAAYLLDDCDEFDVDRPAGGSGNSGDRVEFPQNAAALVDGSGYWHEVIQWAAGRVTHVLNRPNECLALLSELCPETEPPTGHTWQRVWLAGEALVEMRKEKATKTTLGRQLVPRIIRLLERLVAGGHLSPRERARAGMALGTLGDGRPGVGCRPAAGSAPVLPDISWVEIASGQFLMGTAERNVGHSDERPQFRCNLLQRAYRIGRFPVTVAQFEAFVAAGGYRTQKWWTEAGWEWRRKENVEAPVDYSNVFQIQNHPRVGVSWYEADAYCRWLHAHRSTIGVPQDWFIRLPWEAEWERAARFTDGRMYPWKGEAEPDACCNMGMQLGHTSAVGMYPTGDSEEGIADLSGNVWEWSATQWRGNYEKYEQQVDNSPEGEHRRVFRGAAWFVSADNVRCAYRSWSGPWRRILNLGFRVAASPFL